MELDRELIDKIVQMVFDKVKNSRAVNERCTQRRVLALFSAGKSGAEDARLAVRAICDRGHQVRAMFTANAEKINGPDWLLEKAPSTQLLPREPAVSPMLTLEDADVVIFPVLTCNSASKLALGIADNPVISTAMFAMLNGKPVIAADDSFCFESATPYNEIFKNHRQRLERCGLRFTKAAALADAALRERSDSSAADSRHSLVCEDIGNYFEGSLLSAQDVRMWRQKTLLVNKRAIVTPAAVDAALERNIQIMFRD
jgi:hypothetical protein